MNLYDAAQLRMSVRSFCNEELNREMINALSSFIEEVPGYFPSMNVHVEMIRTGSRKMRPPYYAVLYSEEQEGCYINAGFVLEQIVLYLTSRGVGTCYKMAPPGIKRRDELGRKYMLSIAFGLAKEEVYRNPDKAKRMEFDRLCVMKATPTRDMRTLLNIARLSPSAFNGQPWRFVVTDKKIHVYKQKSGRKMADHISDLDIGIMLGNVFVCAEDLWIDIEPEQIQELREKEYANNHYMTTIRFL